VAHFESLGLDVSMREDWSAAAKSSARDVWDFVPETLHLGNMVREVDEYFGLRDTVEGQKGHAGAGGTDDGGFDRMSEEEEEEGGGEEEKKEEEEKEEGS